MWKCSIAPAPPASSRKTDPAAKAVSDHLPEPEEGVGPVLLLEDARGDEHRETDDPERESAPEEVEDRDVERRGHRVGPLARRRLEPEQL